MKDNISLIAAAAGGFMLSVALAGILRGAPVTAWQEHSNVRSNIVTDLRITPKKTDNLEFFGRETQKS
ncbi:MULTISPECIES: hypothetical protein [unclassified Anabaena]|uniref:hypothetical protein n=1 Tax=unclassified Anabaena TaxID=2619674 RepID=UPI0016845690|nr:hypothetical protein [Anabaena sp. UHCC 0399]MBD2359731.1 hypothetical protein [Anabaena minutissima FACHB-250]MEA5568538.1 hypothetical protein [Anabaena sp. UHCC 0399]